MKVCNPFTVEELKKYWNEFAQRLRQEKREIEYQILANRQLELTADYIIRIKLDNMIQVDQLNGFKADLADFLRKNLRNNHIMIESVISEAEVQKIIYTSEDKLKFLTEKYPVIDDLKKRLGLDTDF